jgi:glyoxylase-like metal-dependent hydrolase (beta-lactamase superfamily II)
MRPTIKRRDFLTRAAAGVAAGALPRAVFGQPSGSALTIEPLDENLAVIVGAGANVVVAASAEELLLVDGGLEERSPELLQLVADRYSGKAIGTLFNTNWRAEHVGSNAALRASGARIVAHENTKLWLGGDFYVDWEKRAYKPNPPQMLPTDTFYTSGQMQFGGDEVRYACLPRAHTDGDIYVLFPRANVLVVSDVLAVGGYPIVDYSTGGWIGGLEQATRKLLEITNDGTRIVPATGAVQSQEALRAQLTLCETVRERVREAFRNGMSLADFVASAPTREFDAERGDPSQFLALVYKGAWGHNRELGGTI